MMPPQDFVDRLTREFDGRLRIRWSDMRGEWHIEHHVGRAVLPPRRIDDEHDDLIRARDGYEFVMAIRPGDRMPCPRCGLTLSLVPFAFQETTCPRCKAEGRESGTRAVFFPLGDALLEELRKRDPIRDGGPRMLQLMDQANRRLELTRQREFSTYHEAVAKDSFNQLFQIQSVGYTGREFTPAAETA